MTVRDRLVLGTRGSKLALTQSQQTAELITERTGIPVDLTVISTRGDRIQDRALAEIGGKGLFTQELEAALREGRIDFAVHSLKDLPTEDPEGLMLGAVPKRQDPRDALAGASLSELAAGALVGTGSLRRQAQLNRLRPDVQTADIRGNVDTRLRKLDDGHFNAIVLAMAGLNRLGIQRDDIFPIDEQDMVPAVGQGALAIQCRADDRWLRDQLASVECALTRRCVEAERAFLTGYGGGCNVPAACHAKPNGDGILITAVAPDSAGQLVRLALSGSDGLALGAELAGRLR